MKFINRQDNQKGFTLIELLLAMTFFSFILLFISMGFIMINRSYNKGITVKLVQDEGRKLVEQLTREIRTTDSSSITFVAPTDCLALDGYRYYWSQPVGEPGRLLREEGKSCGDPIDTANPAGEDQLNERVGVQFISLNPINSTTYELKVVLSTKEADLLIGTDEFAECTTDQGSQYCDVVTYTTIISSRSSLN